MPARRETLTVGAVEKIAFYLKAARANPGLRFSGVTGLPAAET